MISDTGFVERGTDHGLYVHETRLISRLRYRVNGEVPRPVAVSGVEQHSWLGYYAIKSPAEPKLDDAGSGQMAAVSEETIEFRVSRSVGGGMHEDLDFVNHTQKPASLELTVELDADFADLDEAVGRKRQQRGTLQRRWEAAEAGGTLTFHYHAAHDYDHQGDRGHAEIDRAAVVRVVCAGSAPRHRHGALRFAIELAPHATWHACLLIAARVEEIQLEPTPTCYGFGQDEGAFAERRLTFLRGAARFSSGRADPLAADAIRAIQQATRDLIGLRLYDLDHGERAWTLAAGVPLYVALFGRDTMTAAWEAALLTPAIMEGTLEELVGWQGTRVDDWRDEQPGRMLHEAHTGPLSILQFNPRQRYYGSVNAPAIFPVVLGELWHWTGRLDLIRPLVQPALKGLQWLDTWSDRDHDGFYDYKTSSTQGVKNQGWKDSGDAIVYADGRQVEPPTTLATEQGYVFGAKMLMADILWALDDRDGAERLYREAQALKKRFNDVFWMEAEGFVAMGRDCDGHLIRSIGSGGGHAIATGILDAAHVRRAADRLLADDMFNGWGVRTLSADHPAYDPFSYHRGSVWPAEQGAFALGFFRYGLHDHLHRLARAMIESARLFDHHRLPEVFSGHPRDRAHPFPAFYPKSNAPQAWSASALFCLLQALLGIYPYAPLNLLLVDPHLPEWLPEMTVERLRVGNAAATIRFERRGDGSTDYTVLDSEGPLHVVRQPSPWSLTASFGERLKDGLTSLLPSR